MAKSGLALFVGLRDLDIPELQAQLGSYRSAWRESGQAGRASVYLRLPVYAGETEESALEDARESITYFFKRHAELTQAGLGRAGAGPDDRRAARLERLKRMTYDEICRTRVVFGTAPALIDRLRALQQELGLDGIIIEPNAGGSRPAGAGDAEPPHRGRAGDAGVQVAEVWAQSRQRASRVARAADGNGPWPGRPAAYSRCSRVE